MNILIAEDHALFRDGLKLLLAPLDEILNVIEASTLSEALDVCAGEVNLDLVLLDFDAPGVDGTVGLRVLLRMLPEVPVVVFGSSGGREEALAAIALGARGYFHRGVSGPVMVSALRLVLAGETYVSPALLSHRGGYPADGGLDPTLQGDLARLTRRQREVLVLLADGHSNGDIAEILSIEPNTVKNHVKGLMKALGVRNRTEAAVKALKLGLRSRERPAS